MSTIQVQQLGLALQSQDFVRKTIEQIEKDFRMCGIDFQFISKDENEVIVELVLTVQLAIERLSATELQQFIYIIDLKENDFLNAVILEDNGLQLAQRIVYREAYKVYLKAKFSE